MNIEVDQRKKWEEKERKNAMNGRTWKKESEVKITLDVCEASDCSV